MKRYGYMVVEGPHDIELVARLLKPYGFKRIQYMVNLDPFWKDAKLIPNEFPYKDDLLKRVPVPMFFENATHSIAVHSTSGYSRLAETVQETLFALSLNEKEIESLGLILDADADEPVPVRFQRLISELRKQNLDISLPDEPGRITTTTPAVGIYILPDNQQDGTLENILLDTAAINYPDLLSASAQYIQSFNKDELTQQDLEEFDKPAGQKKAQIGSMASILKPGKAIQVSIQDNRWLEGEALNMPTVKSISAFLAHLFELN